jgi:hypothetical protein
MLATHGFADGPACPSPPHKPCRLRPADGGACGTPSSRSPGRPSPPPPAGDPVSLRRCRDTSSDLVLGRGVPRLTPPHRAHSYLAAAGHHWCWCRCWCWGWCWCWCYTWYTGSPAFMVSEMQTHLLPCEDGVRASKVLYRSWEEPFLGYHEDQSLSAPCIPCGLGVCEGRIFGRFRVFFEGAI